MNSIRNKGENRTKKNGIDLGKSMPFWGIQVGNFKVNLFWTLVGIKPKTNSIYF
jgi:hypothetical protein